MKFLVVFKIRDSKEKNIVKKNWRTKQKFLAVRVTAAEDRKIQKN